MTLKFANLTGRIAAFTLLCCLATSIASAQQQADAQATDQPDPEDRNHGVARISLMNGDVSVRRGDSGDFVAAQINAPLLAADAVQTGPASRAEVQFDYANRIRISSGADVRMGDLRDGAFQIQIAHGITTFSILRDSKAQIELSTPSASIRPLHRGSYRLAVLDDGTTQITVRSGDAEIYTPQGSQRIATGQTMLVRGSANDPEYQVFAAIARDDWDLFNERRDHELQNSNAYQYVSTDIQGAEDLDSYGKWRQDPTYGQVWTPTVAADWAPYQAGRWVWGDYYGWTWVSTDPWGWAPYHYGNWFYGNYGWSWWPGPYRSHFWYRPALVGFFGYGTGYGAGFGFGFGFGNIGWVALAPYERFHPWWGHSYGHGFTNVNIVNNTNIYNNYRNARTPNGVASVTSQQFQAGQYGRVSHPTTGQIQSAGLVRGQIPITPTNGNLRFNDRTTGLAARTDLGRQQFVSRGGFNQPQRTSFEQQRQSMQSSFSALRGIQSVGGQAPQAPAAQGQGGRISSTPGTQRSPNAGNSTWQRFGNPNGAPTTQQPSRTTESGSGWGRFGTPSGNSQAPATRPNTGSAGAYNYYQSQTPTPRNNFMGNSTGNSGNTGVNRQGRSVQIAPPIVQPRSQYSAPAGSQGNSRPSAPSYRQPAPASAQHQSAPAQSHPSSGGGGSSSRSAGSGHR
jgi:FecR protein